MATESKVRQSTAAYSLLVLFHVVLSPSSTSGLSSHRRDTDISSLVRRQMEPTRPPTPTAAAATAGHTQTSREIITAGRCRVRCLSQLQTSTELSMLSSQLHESLSLMTCLQDSDCTACLKPCNQPALSQNTCQDVCRLPRENRSCTESCRFLREIENQHPGQCPHGNGRRGEVDGLPDMTPESCGQPCFTDADCESAEKCCSSIRCGVGSTCQQRTTNGLPNIPETPSLRERPRGGAIELRWNPVHVDVTGGDNAASIVLYLIDWRSNTGRLFNEAALSPWQQLAQTTGNSAVVNDVTPGHWYQFRVTAISIHGSRGPSEPTKPYTQNKEPRKPGPPANLTEGDTLISGGQMAVIIHWFPPKKSDLPITRYKVFWSKRLKSSKHSASSSSSSSAASQEMRHVLPGNRLSFQIPHLESDTAYFVQVQAICQYGDVRLKSEKAGIYITTFPLPQDETAADEVQQPESVTKTLPSPLPVSSLTVHKPFVDGADNTVRVNVSWTFTAGTGDLAADKFAIAWSPEACIVDSALKNGPTRSLSAFTNSTWFVLYDLRFDCRYTVRVETVSVRGATGPSRHASFTMPSCSDTQSAGRLKTDCLQNVPSIPPEPSDFRHSFLISGSNITSRLSWSMTSSSTDGAQSVTGYRLVWGQLLPATRHQAAAAMDRSTILTKSLPRNSTGTVIGNLREGTAYLVELQALSRVAVGHSASIQFTTPLLRVGPIDPPYRQVGQSSHDMRRYHDSGSSSSRRRTESAGHVTVGQRIAAEPATIRPSVSQNRNPAAANIDIVTSSATSAYVLLPFHAAPTACVTLLTAVVFSAVSRKLSYDSFEVDVR